MSTKKPSRKVTETPLMGTRIAYALMMIHGDVPFRPSDAELEALLAKTARSQLAGVKKNFGRSSFAFLEDVMRSRGWTYLGGERPGSGRARATHECPKCKHRW